MPGAGRVGDRAFAPADAHNCPKCPHTVQGPAAMGSTNVLVNGKPALRLGDRGVHTACCRANLWASVMGSPTVLVNGRPFTRIGDSILHCGGPGILVMGSPNVLVGEAGGGGDSGSPSSGSPSSSISAPSAEQSSLSSSLPSALKEASHLTQTAAQEALGFIQGRELEHGVANALSMGLFAPTGSLAMPGLRPASIQKLDSVLGAANKGIGVVTGVMKLPGNVSTVFSEKASSQDRWSAASGVVNTASQVLETAGDVESWRTRQAVTAAVKETMKTAAPSVQAAAVEEALRQAQAGPLKGPRIPTKAEEQAVRAAIKTASKPYGGIAVGTGAPHRDAAVKIRKNAATAAMSAAKGPTSRLIAKGAARLVPGLNIGVAAMDTAAFYQTRAAYDRGEVGLGTLVFSGSKAITSWVAATNIPVVSPVAGLGGLAMDGADALIRQGESP